MLQSAFRSILTPRRPHGADVTESEINMHLLLALQYFVADRLEREDGATAVEYGLMVALIAVVIIGAVTTIGTELGRLFKIVADALVAAN